MYQDASDNFATGTYNHYNKAEHRLWYRNMLILELIPPDVLACESNATNIQGSDSDPAASNPTDYRDYEELRGKRRTYVCNLGTGHTSATVANNGVASPIVKMNQLQTPAIDVFHGCVEWRKLGSATGSMSLKFLQDTYQSHERSLPLHSGKFNIVFGDNHVSAVTPKEVTGTYFKKGDSPVNWSSL